MNSPAGPLRRRAGLVCLAAAPLLLLAATAADPAVGDVDFATGIAADPQAARLHSLLLHWSWVLFVPGLLAMLSPISRRGSVLASVSWLAAVLGLTTFAGLTLSDFFGLAVLETAGQGAFARVEEQVAGFGWLTFGWQLPGLIGWALAMIVTPFALARAGLTGWWYPGVAVPGFALYLLFAIEPAPLSLTGPLLLTVANVTLAIRWWRHEPGERPEAGFAALRRKASIASLVAAPLALAAGMATLPGGAFHIDEFAADPAAAQASAFFLHLGWLLFLPGVLVVTGRITGRGRVLAAISAAVALLGLAHFNGLMIGDYAALAAAQLLDPAQVSAIETRTGEDAWLALGVALPGMLGTLLGLILVPVAAARAGLVRWPVPLAAALGVVAFLALTTGRLPGLAAPLLLLAAYGMLARALARPVASPEENPAAQGVVSEAAR